MLYEVITVNPECREAFVAAARETIGVARRLGTRTIITTVGNEQERLNAAEVVKVEVDRRKIEIAASYNFV